MIGVVRKHGTCLSSKVLHANNLEVDRKKGSLRGISPWYSGFKSHRPHFQIPLPRFYSVFILLPLPECLDLVELADVAEPVLDQWFGVFSRSGRLINEPIVLLLEYGLLELDVDQGVYDALVAEEVHDMWW